MMRVTPGMSSIATQRDLQRLSAQVLRIQQQATTGTRVLRAADDPAASSALGQVRSDQAANAQHQRNIEQALAEVDGSESLLGNAAEVLNRAHEVALAMANGSVDASERQLAANEVAGLREQLLALANHRDGGVFVFGGYRTDSSPFAVDGAFLGDTHRRRVPVDGGVTLEVGISGADAFGAAGGTDSFAALEALQSALSTNDAGAVSRSTEALAKGSEQLTRARAVLGQQHNALQAMSDGLTEREVQLAEHASALVDADPLETFSGLASAQSALNGAVQVAARLLSTLSLVDRL
jgi:flagellar hook-associated protein 3 FlgL